MRDILNRGRERQSLFAAATKSVSLSKRAESVIRDLKLDAGYGTSRMAGPFIGVEGRFTLGFTAKAEYVARTLNAELAIPVTRNVQARLYSLNGHVFYGAALSIRK